MLDEYGARAHARGALKRLAAHLCLVSNACLLVCTHAEPAGSTSVPAASEPATKPRAAEPAAAEPAAEPVAAESAAAKSFA